MIHGSYLLVVNIGIEPPPPHTHTLTHTQTQECKPYDNVQDEESCDRYKDLPAIPEGHYEMDTVNEEPYWEPASVDDKDFQRCSRLLHQQNCIIIRWL